jgi:regulator of replication initiation timing
MNDESDNKGYSGQSKTGNVNITVGNISNVSGQVGVGVNIKQEQTLSSSDKKELLDSLEQFQKEIANLGLPDDELSDVNNDVNTAIDEAKTEEPNYSRIKRKFEDAIETVKDVGDTIEKVSKWKWTGKIVKILGKLGLAIAL